MCECAGEVKITAQSGRENKRRRWKSYSGRLKMTDTALVQANKDKSPVNNTTMP